MDPIWVNIVQDPDEYDLAVCLRPVPGLAAHLAARLATAFRGCRVPGLLIIGLGPGQTQGRQGAVQLFA